MNEGSKKNSRSPLNDSSLWSLGINLMAGMVFFTGIGYWIDKERESSSGEATLIGMFLGLFYGFYEVWKLMRKMTK